MGNAYYHDAYYGLDGAGELIVPLIPYIIAAQILWAVWDWFNGGSLLNNIKGILIGWLKIIACLVAFVVVMLVIIMVVANIQYVIPLFFLSVIVFHYWFDSKPRKMQMLSKKNDCDKSEFQNIDIRIPPPPPPLYNDWIYSDSYGSNAPINEFLINRAVRFAEGEPYYVYYKHGHTNDVLYKEQECLSYSTYFQYDIIPANSEIAHIICRAVIANKGAFAYYPQSIKYIYKNGASEEFPCKGYEILGNESAAESIFNESAPHPKCPWSRIKGSLDVS